MEAKKEIWKPVYLKEYKNIYEVSNTGYVRKGNFVTKGNLNNQKYRRIVLKNGEFKRTIAVHRLVKFTFEPVENPELYDIHHRDRVKDNNNLPNLQSLTKKEHIELEIKLGNNKIGKYGKKNLRFKGLIGCFNKEGYLINIYEGSFDLKISGFDPTRVYKVINKIRKTHKGYIWKRFPKKHKPEVGKQYDMSDPMFDRTIKKTKKQPIVQMAFKF